MNTGARTAYVFFAAFAIYLITTLPLVIAEPDVRKVVTNDQIFQKYAADASKSGAGVCKITYFDSLLENSPDATGYWPSGPLCGDAAPQTFQYGGTEWFGKLQVKTSTEYDGSMEPAMPLIISHYVKENRMARKDFHHYRDHFVLSEIPTILYDRQPAYIDQRVPLFALAFYGENLDITYSKSTMYPSSVASFEVERGGGMSNSFWEKYGEMKESIDFTPMKEASFGENVGTGIGSGVIISAAGLVAWVVGSAAIAAIGAGTFANAAMVAASASGSAAVSSTLVNLGNTVMNLLSMGPVGWIIAAAVVITTVVAVFGYGDSDRYTGIINTGVNANNPYTLPIPFACQKYVVEIKNAEKGFISETKEMTPMTGGYKYIQSNRESSGTNTITVEAYTTNKRLNKVHIIADDSTDVGGGFLAIVYCDGVVDPDTDKSVCDSNSDWQWSAAVNASTENVPPQACCGDDGVTDVKEVAGYRCTNTSATKYSWVPPDPLCFKKVSDSTDICCKTAADNGNLIFDGTVTRACVASGAGVTWRNPATDKGQYTVSLNHTNKSIAAKGTAWSICGNTNQSSTQAVNVVTVKAIATSVPTTASATAALNYAATTCNVNNACPNSVPCTNNVCTCSGFTVWNGTSCEAPVCGVDQDVNTAFPPTKPCVPKVATAQTGTAPITLPVASVCTVEEPNICTSAWQSYRTTNVYGVSKSGDGYVSTPAIQAEYICTNGKLTPTTAKIAQNLMGRGFCPDDACFFLPDANTPASVRTAMGDGSCIKNGQWALDHYCTGGSWTTRTQILADTFTSFKKDKFIIQCDTYLESLNDPTKPAPFAKEQATPSRVNSFCSISEIGATGTPLVAVGTTLNSNSGLSNGQSANANLLEDPLFITEANNQKFVQIINNTRLEAAQKECQSLRGNADFIARNDVYLACDASAGSVLYNPKTSTIIFTTAEGFTIPLNTYGVIDKNMAPNVETVRPLAGRQIYYAKNGEREINGVVQPEGTVGKPSKFGTVVFQGINVGQYYRNRVAGRQGWSLTTADSDTVVKLNLSKTTTPQIDWEYFTLQLRP